MLRGFPDWSAYELLLMALDPEIEFKPERSVEGLLGIFLQVAC